MSVWCQICNEMKSCDETVQLIPCLHTFCNQCMSSIKRSAKLCPAVHCYCNVQSPEQFTSSCEAEKCLKKIAINAEMLRTVCHHDICQSCFDAACRKDTMTCPAPACGESMMDEDDLVCDGPCKKALSYDKIMIIPCCGARMCDECSTKWTNGKDFCPPGRCIVKEVMKKKKSSDINRQTCQCSSNCDGEVLRNFPSEFECEHDVCMNCIAAMLDECERNGKTPNCPNKTCGVPYRCDSVLALRAQFPERKEFFSKFSLSVQFSIQTLKDDTVTEIYIADTAKNPNANKKFSLRIGHCDDEEILSSIDFVNDGTLGDLIREVRRALNILATDKIYGYYQVDESNNRTILEVTKNSILKTCSELNINEKNAILIDTSGIVSASHSHSAEKSIRR